MRMVNKSTTAERANHWVLVLSFLLLTLTGLGFAFRSLNWLNTIVGGNHLAAIFHEWGGLVFLASLLLSMGSYLGVSLRYGPEDSAWFRLRGGYLSKGVEVPPQDRLNAGQKLFYLTVLLFGLLISATGLVMWLAGGSRGWMQLSHLLHYISFVVLVTAVPIHIYLATAANPGTFRIMTRGTVPVEWARKRHGKWLKEIGME